MHWKKKTERKRAKMMGSIAMKRSADTTLITSITALFFTHNNKTQMFDCICGGKAYDENKLLYVHEYFGHNLKT